MGSILFKKITAKSELKESFRLRYRVYIEERGFERREDHPGGIEVDLYDKHSVHFAAFNDKGNVIGTARIILYSEDGFPLEKNCVLNGGTSMPDRRLIGEVSRLAVSKDYRRRAEDHFIYDEDGDAPPDLPATYEERRRRHEIVIGLYKLVYIESKKMALTHWYTAMGKGLFLLLTKMGVIFDSIGPAINYHGLRTPYLGDIAAIEKKVLTLNPAFFQETNKELARSMGENTK